VRNPPPRFFVPDPFGDRGMVTIGEDAARHMRVRRLAPGAPVVLLDGHGRRATATLTKLARRNATVEIERVESVPSLPELHLLVPVADRERMLWLAEKATELGVTSWRPIVWKRSRSVSPRGEGSGFQNKVRARMASAAEQADNAWLPITFPDATLDRAMAAAPSGARYVLSQDGRPALDMLSAGVRAPLTLAVGPEGGFEPDELAMVERDGFVRISVGTMMLRFETAGVLGAAYARAALSAREGGP
jgi:16S rRNA (uracil1498-N3)-methyltransferase